MYIHVYSIFQGFGSLVAGASYVALVGVVLDRFAGRFAALATYVVLLSPPYRHLQSEYLFICLVPTEHDMFCSRRRFH